MDHFSQVSQSLVTGISLTDRLGSYFEWFALFRDNLQGGYPQHFLNAGFTYLVTPNFQLDWRAGFGLNDTAEDFFTGAGFVLRL